VADTPDLVQDTLLQTFKRLNGFEPRGEGALQAYLRQALMNRIRDEVRRAGRQPDRETIDSGRPDPGLSPLEQAIGTEAVDRYEQALARLRDDERELVIGRVELGLTYQELADACGKPSADAARMAVGRALVRLAEEMRGSTGPR
jgi:RNA polymerase sigma-70 factor (ECF subfamily)